MDRKLIMVLVRDIETSMKIITIALKEGNIRLALEALTNAENELAAIRRQLERQAADNNE